MNFRSCLFGMTLFAALALMVGSSADAQAQVIDCSGGCTTVQYGLGNDPKEGPYLNTVGLGHPGPGDGSCGPKRWFRFQGRIKMMDQDSCVVSSTNRCMVEVPLGTLDSGYSNVNLGTFDLGPLGILNGLGALFTDVSNNIGHRQLNGTCTDTGTECGLDTDCTGGTDVCRSTCFSDPSTLCGSHQDCVDAGLGANDCVTKTEFDGIGTCGDNVTMCTDDSDCPVAGDVCFAGWRIRFANESCVCCQSTTATACAAIAGWVESPAVNCPFPAWDTPIQGASDFIFEGGRGTKFAHNFITPPGQQEGLCAGTVKDGTLDLGGVGGGNDGGRPCGARGDFWAGANNGKCASGAATCGDDPFDPSDPALPSSCDDVAFGGIAGDFCDFRERGVRARDGQPNVNPDGTYDVAQCQATISYMVATPNALCTIPTDIPDGDPQAGCSLTNFGIAAQPDLDCNGIDDTVEGRCMGAGGTPCSDPAICPPCAQDSDCASGVCVSDGDLCPFIGEEFFFRDSNNDNIGDECQCGDQSGDGSITSIDIAGTAQCANGLLPFEACNATLVDTDADNATTALDIAGVVATVNGILAPSDLRCLRNIAVTAP